MVSYLFNVPHPQNVLMYSRVTYNTHNKAALKPLTIMQSKTIALFIQTKTTEISFAPPEMQRHTPKGCEKSRLKNPVLKPVTSGRAHLHGLAHEQHNSKETLQRWRAVGNTVSHFNGPGIESQIFSRC